MKTSTTVIKLPFDKLIHLFFKESGNQFSLDTNIGKGYLQIFDLEQGLQARLWDCSFEKVIEMYNDVDVTSENWYFSLAFFLKIHGLQFANKGSILEENTIWDTIFLSSISNYKIHIASKATISCLSVSFSKKWLNNNVLKSNKAFKNLKVHLDTTASFSLLESMSISEKGMIQELLDASWEKAFGSFYIKSVVLKIIYDFFSTLSEKQTFNTNDVLPCTAITEVEKYLHDHISGPLPNLKNLADKFVISESTLKRRFKRRHGVNMSTYFLHKKIEYAKQIMENKNISETASMLGYKNANSFINMFKKYMRPDIST